MMLWRDILFGLLAGAAVGLWVPFFGYFVPEFWEHLETKTFSVTEVSRDFSSAIQSVAETPELSILLGGLLASGWILWKSFRAIERKIRERS